MSNPITNFITNGSGISQDLSEIFQPLGNATKLSYNTGFIVNGYGDLSSIFAPLNGGKPISFNTGFIVNGYDDLKNIFLPLLPFLISNSNLAIVNYSSGYYTITFIGNNSIIFNKSINNVNLLVVGGGGNGSPPSYDSFNNLSGGGGSGHFFHTSLITPWSIEE